MNSINDNEPSKPKNLVQEMSSINSYKEDIRSGYDDYYTDYTRPSLYDQYSVYEESLTYDGLSVYEGKPFSYNEHSKDEDPVFPIKEPPISKNVYVNDNDESPHSFSEEIKEEENKVDNDDWDDLVFNNSKKQPHSTRDKQTGEKIIYIKIEDDSQFKFSGTELYVTPRGVFEQPQYVKKDKYEKCQEIAGDIFEIGRRAPDPEKRNVIRFLSVNTSVDKDHAQLIWKTAYNKYSPWVRSFFCFLWVQKQKTLNKTKKFNVLSRIPFEINELILQFAQEPFNFYLQDRGSSKDTFEKVSYFIPKRLQADQELLLGADVYVSILEVKDTFNVEGQASYSDESLFSHSLRKLLKEEVEIVGTGNEHLYYLQSSVDDIDEAQYPQLKFVKWDSYFNFEIPYVKLEITYKNAPLTAKPQKVLFFPHVQDTFTFGRSYEVDIPVMSSTCSRRQARISWEHFNGERCWVVYDGEPDKGTLNGTWLNIRTITEKKNEMSSRPVPIQHKSVFRFGDNSATFLIDKVNFDEQDLQRFRKTLDTLKMPVE